MAQQIISDIQNDVKIPLSLSKQLVENNIIPRMPIFLDSPLAIKLTAVYKKYEK